MPDDLPSEGLEHLRSIMAALRTPGTGCPWDLEQTFASIAPYTIEEAYEVKDAIDRHDMVDLRDELGDLLLQVVFHSRMAEEREAFSLDHVIDAICTKMIRRHPQVFGNAEPRDTSAQTASWEAIKAAERAEKQKMDNPLSALDGVARALPPLTRAEKLQKRAARVGFDWPDAAPVLAKLREEADEVASALNAEDLSREGLLAEVGDVLFSAVNLARKLGFSADQALENANTKFEARFRAMEQTAAQDGATFAALPLDQQEALWQRVKGLLQHE